MEIGRPTRSSRVGITTTAVLVVLMASFLAAGGEGSATTVVPLAIAALAIAVSAWALLRVRRQRREHEERLMAWAGERAAQAERLRIARDLHDLVSHGLGLITVRAASASATSDEAERTLALTDIERASRETTTELRRMLTVLRTPASGDAVDPVPLRPADTLADLPGIVAAAHDAGLEATLDLPELAHVSPGAQLTICAVVREALHNVLRHAGPTRGEVAVLRTDGALVVTVRDDGPRAGWDAQRGAGQGLIGLRERITALGGTLDATPDGPGFLVTARIPDEPTA